MVIPLATVIDDLEIRVNTNGLDALFDSLKKIQNGFDANTKSANEFANATSKIGRAAESAGKGAQKGSSGLKEFGASLVRIAKYRLIRTAIKEITSAFKEGLQNAYNFSKGLTGDGNGLAAAMDSLSTKSLTMRNQMGAAFGSLLQSVTPILIKIIELVTRAANAITQLFAFLGGQGGYMKAVDATGDMAKNLGGAGKAAKELRRTLMGFDEINRLDAPSNPSGGGGGSLEDYSKMFEWTPFDGWTEKLVPLKQAIEDFLQTVKEQAIAAWNNIKEQVDFNVLFQGIMDALTGVVEFVGGILSGDWDTAFAGAAKAVEGLGAIVEQVANFLWSIVSSLFGKLIDSVSGFFDWLSEKTGIDFTGLKNFIVGILQSLWQWIGSMFESLKTIFHGLTEFLAGVFTGDWDRAWQGVKQIFEGVWHALLNTLIGICNIIIDSINGILSTIDWVASKFGGGMSFRIEHFPAYATGGFPEENGFFFANSTELVGQFSNGNTAVANNEQIVQGISRGVFEAVTAALATSNGGSSEVKVYLDGKQITNAVTRNQRQTSRATGVAFA